jgi:hypothetical protein
MSFFKDLINSETGQKFLDLVQEVMFEQLFDYLEKVVERTKTPEDNEALARLLEEAASRVREKAPATGEGA